MKTPGGGWRRRDWTAGKTIGMARKLNNSNKLSSPLQDMKYLVDDMIINRAAIFQHDNLYDTSFIAVAEVVAGITGKTC